MLRIVALLTTVALAALTGARVAYADGDPASDYLYTQRVFFPYTVTVSKPAQSALRDTLTTAERAGYPIRVALIAGPGDLGVVTSLAGKPEQYAKFLDLELAFVYKGPLLIVMPQGIGFAHYRHLTSKEEKRLASIKVEAGGDGLAYTAVKAVGALAGQAGHPIALTKVPGLPSASTTSGSGSPGLDNRLLALLVAFAFVVVVGGGALLIRRVASR